MAGPSHTGLKDSRGPTICTHCRLTTSPCAVVATVAAAVVFQHYLLLPLLSHRVILLFYFKTGDVVVLVNLYVLLGIKSVSKWWGRGGSMEKKKKKETTNLNSIVSVVSLLSALLMLQKFLISNTLQVKSIQHFCLEAILKKNACKMHCRVPDHTRRVQSWVPSLVKLPCTCITSGFFAFWQAVKNRFSPFQELSVVLRHRNSRDCVQCMVWN